MIRRLLFVLLLLVAIVPVEAKKNRSSKKNVPHRCELTSAQARRLSYYLVEAVKQKSQGNVSAAMDLYQHCLDIDADCPEALFEVGLMKLSLRDDSIGTQMLERAAELSPANPRYQEMLSMLYISNERYEDAIPVQERLAKIQKNNSEQLYTLVGLYEVCGKFDKALDALDRMEMLEGKNVDLYQRKFSIYESMGKTEKGFSVLMDAEKEFPHDLKLKRSLALHYLAAKRHDKALEYIEKVQTADPDGLDMHELRVIYYKAVDKDSLSSALLDSLLYLPNMSGMQRESFLKLKVREMMSTSTFTDEALCAVLDSILVVAPKDADVLRMYASVLTDMQAPVEKQTEILNRLLEVEPDNDKAIAGLLVIYLNQDDNSKVIDVCRFAVNSCPEQLRFHYFLGMGLYREEKTHEALEAFQNGLHQVEESSDRNMVSELWAAIGDTQHELGEMELAYAAYDSCLVYRSDNASCLNNYAYFLCLDNKDLNKAEEMSFRSLKLDPNNKTYLDTYAWILYTLGQYSEALRYIDRVVSPNASDDELRDDESLHPEVLMHAFDIYMKNDMPEQAERYKRISNEK